MGALPDNDPRLGSMVANKYRLEQLLGIGGVGMVYRAENVLLGRTVAIKLLKPEFAQNKDLVSRFIREARAANLVRHANVVDVLDVGLDDAGVPYIVQELLHGGDLSQYIHQHGALAPDAAITLLLPVVDAVAFAHVMGVVHRDLKPENIFITQTDGAPVPKVLDFGISKMGMPGEVRITSTGVSMGTPAYMSPEQIQRFAEIDARADVWALGVILYEMVTGELPFAAQSPGALFVEICTREPIPLSERTRGLGEDFERVVMRCLRSELEERYPTAAELARDLRNLREGRAIEPTQRIALVSLPPSPIEASGDDATGSGARRTTGTNRRPTGDRRTTGNDKPTSVEGSAVRRAAGAPRARAEAETLAEIPASPAPAAPTPPPIETPAIAAPAPARRGPVIALAGALALGVVVLGVVATRAPSHPAVAAPEHATVAPASHSLVVESTPSGASVAEDGRVLGTTPLTIALDRGEPRQFVVSLPGYVPYVIHQDRADRDVQVVAALVASQAPTAQLAIAPPSAGDPAPDERGEGAPHAGESTPRRAARGRNAARSAHAASSATATAQPPPSGPSLGIRMER